MLLRQCHSSARQTDTCDLNFTERNKSVHSPQYWWTSVKYATFQRSIHPRRVTASWQSQRRNGNANWNWHCVRNQLTWLYTNILDSRTASENICILYVPCALQIKKWLHYSRKTETSKHLKFSIPLENYEVLELSTPMHEMKRDSSSYGCILTVVS